MYMDLGIPRSQFVLHTDDDILGPYESTEKEYRSLHRYKPMQWRRVRWRMKSQQQQQQQQQSQELTELP